MILPNPTTAWERMWSQFFQNYETTRAAERDALNQKIAALEKRISQLEPK